MAGRGYRLTTMVSYYFMKKKMFFDGELLDCGIPLKCYLAGISRKCCSEYFKVNIVGEEIR